MELINTYNNGRNCHSIKIYKKNFEDENCTTVEAFAKEVNNNSIYTFCKHKQLLLCCVIKKT